MSGDTYPRRAMFAIPCDECALVVVGKGEELTLAHRLETLCPVRVMVIKTDFLNAPHYRHDRHLTDCWREREEVPIHNWQSPWCTEAEKGAWSMRREDVTCPECEAQTAYYFGPRQPKPAGQR